MNSIKYIKAVTLRQARTGDFLLHNFFVALASSDLRATLSIKFAQSNVDAHSKWLDRNETFQLTQGQRKSYATKSRPSAPSLTKIKWEATIVIRLVTSDDFITFISPVAPMVYLEFKKNWWNCFNVYLKYYPQLFSWVEYRNATIISNFTRPHLLNLITYLKKINNRKKV